MKTSPDFDSIKQREEALLFRTYGRYPIAVKRGFGSRLWDFDGKEYIDLLSGIAVTALGHCNEEVAEAVSAQVRKLVHVSNLFYQEEQLDLAERILKTAHFDKVFFCNSGAEANEAAFKLARRYQQRVLNKDAYEVITFEGAFHGRTLAAIAATGRYQDGFAPIPEGFKQAPFADLAALERMVSDKTAAVLLEIIQGEGGVRLFPQDFLKQLESFCKAKGILFMVDEVQAGLGRTGKWWAFQNFNLKPDIITTAKALANGLPMGAMMATDEVARGFVAGSHATTFGAGALVSRAAEKTLEIIERDRLIERAEELGVWAKSHFASVAKRCGGKIKEIRGMGLMIGIELTFPGKKVWEALLHRGFILNLTQERVLRLLPALNVPKEDLELFGQALEEELFSLPEL